MPLTATGSGPVMASDWPAGCGTVAAVPAGTAWHCCSVLLCCCSAWRCSCQIQALRTQDSGPHCLSLMWRVRVTVQLSQSQPLFDCASVCNVDSH